MGRQDLCKAIGWEIGKQDAYACLRNLNQSDVAAMKHQGLTKGMAEEWRDIYRQHQQTIDNMPRASNAVNTPKARADLMDLILEWWED